MSGSGRSAAQTAGRSASPKSRQRLSAVSCRQRTPAGFPAGIPGMGEEMEAAMQQAPHPGRHSMPPSFNLDPAAPVGGSPPGSKGPAMPSLQTVYKLRNHPQRAFRIEAAVEAAGNSGATVTATVREGDGEPFTYVVEFSGEFVASKSNFDPEMYLHTAISVVQSQLESLKHGSTLLRVHRASGLIETSPLSASRER
jgi:hypothetical protein